jgi:beta-lactamase regulating signal transducer with metallopeptidase domain
MMFEYTLLTTLAFHHLLIGGLLTFALLLLNKLLTFSAETRSWLWMTAFIVSTIIPFTLITTDTRPQADVANLSNNTIIVDGPRKSIVVNREAILPSGDNWHLPSEIVFNVSFVLSIGMIIWLIGSLWRTGTMLGTVMRTQKLLNSTLNPVSSLSKNLDVNVLASQTGTSPMLVGLWKPKIIVPQNILDELPDEQLTAIVLHERAHISRKDNWFSVLQELVVILFWWSPVIRFLSKKIHVEREIACDLRAVAQMKSGKQYAQSLLACAKLMLDEQQNVLAMGLFSKKKELNHRVGAVLMSNAGRIPSLKFIGLLCILLGASTLQAAQQLSPKISIRNTAVDARIYSMLPRRDSEALLAAVANNDIQSINTLLSQGVDINTPLIGDGTALMLAVRRGNQYMVQALINLGADVNQASMMDGNPLIVAAQTNNRELAEVLLDHGADVNGFVRRDETPLINASNYGHLEMTKFLVEHGADVNLSVSTGAEDGFEIRSPLNRARNIQIKEYLISNGAIE